ncbi:MAG: sodium:calcium symporter [Myxococcota bacterium]|nr:sodium:calcium symporter [Myxococcota bacterium]
MGAGPEDPARARTPASGRDRWATRIGLVLALAGCAVGLGNFLRFPGQAAANGGGAFLIPYLLSLLLVGMPLLWAECAMGRFGGQYGRSHTPGILDRMWPHPSSKYIGVFGVFIPFTVALYYIPITSWCLAFSWFSLTGAYTGLESRAEIGSFLSAFQGWEANRHFSGHGATYLFFGITLGATIFVLAGGIARGIERLARIAFPALFAMAVLLMVWVLLLEPPAGAGPGQGVLDGLGFVWNPRLGELMSARVWLAAAGQVFFTLSVGWGIVQTYTSYLGPDDDVALAGLSTASLNEFAEIVLGGTIAITAAVVFFGVTATQEIASSTFDLGFQSMAVIFQQLPAGNLVGGVWFLLLFFAGLTSAVAITQPMIALLEDAFGLSRGRAVAAVGLALLFLSTPVIWLHGVLDELDFWAGTFSLLVFGLAESVIFAWLFGIDRGWSEITRGARIRVPGIVRPVLRYVTPGFLGLILLAFAIQELPAVIEKSGTAAWVARGLALAIFLGIAVIARRALAPGANPAPAAPAPPGERS